MPEKTEEVVEQAKSKQEDYEKMDYDVFEPKVEWDGVPKPVT